MRAGSRSTIESRQGDVHSAVLSQLQARSAGIEERDSFSVRVLASSHFRPNREISSCFESAQDVARLSLR